MHNFHITRSLIKQICDIVMLTPILQIDGKAELSFDVPSLYKSVEYIYSEEFDTSDYVDINVQVTELLTGNYYYLNLKCNI